MRFSEIRTKDHELFVRLAIDANVARRLPGHDWIDVRINQRAALIARIAECRLPDGNMYVAQYGSDCDGIKYQGDAYKIEASASAYWAERNAIARWADGPFDLAIHHPHNLPEPWSCDLAATAFENGAYHIYA